MVLGARPVAKLPPRKEEKEPQEPSCPFQQQHQKLFIRLRFPHHPQRFLEQHNFLGIRASRSALLPTHPPLELRRTISSSFGHVVKNNEN
jgi:hypothetical protein